MAQTPQTTRPTWTPIEHRRLDAIAGEMKRLSNRELGLLAAKLVDMENRRGTARKNAEIRRNIVNHALTCIDRKRPQAGDRTKSEGQRRKGQR